TKASSTDQQNAKTYADGIVRAQAVNDYYTIHGITNPGPTDVTNANNYAAGIVLTPAVTPDPVESALQDYLDVNPGQDAMWFARGAAASRDPSTTLPIFVPSTAKRNIMSGVQHTFTPGNRGIRVTAKLTESDSAFSSQGLGREPPVSNVAQGVGSAGSLPA